MSELLSFDQKGYQSQISQYEGQKNALQEVINLFNAMDIGPFENANLPDIIYETESFLFNRIMKDQPTNFLGMKLSKEKVYGMMERPPGYKAFISKVDILLKYRLKDFTNIFDFKSYFNYVFTIDHNNQVLVLESAINDARSEHERYIHSEKAILHLKVANQIAELISTSGIMDEPIAWDHLNVNNYFRNTFQIDSANNRVRVNIIEIAAIDTFCKKQAKQALLRERSKQESQG